MMIRNRGKLIALLCAAVLVVGIIILSVPWRISVTVQAVEIDISDPLYCKSRKITLDGKYFINLLNEDRFSGKIVLTGYDETQDSNIMKDVNVTSSNGGAVLSYYNDVDQEWEIFGDVYSNRFFRNIVISINGKDSEQKTKYIIGEVTTRDEAVDIMNGLSIMIS